MWSRVVEVMLGLWLILSPFIFRHPFDHTWWWVNDLSCGLLTIVLALFSFWPPCRQAHLAIILVALWLIGFGYFSAPWPAPAALQNAIFLGLILGMMAIIPNHASRPPASWEENPETLAPSTE